MGSHGAAAATDRFFFIHLRTEKAPSLTIRFQKYLFFMDKQTQVPKSETRNMLTNTPGPTGPCKLARPESLV